MVDVPGEGDDPQSQRVSHRPGWRELQRSENGCRSAVVHLRRATRGTEDGSDSVLAEVSEPRGHPDGVDSVPGKFDGERPAGAQGIREGFREHLLVRGDDLVVEEFLGTPRRHVRVENHAVPRPGSELEVIDVAATGEIPVTRNDADAPPTRLRGRRERTGSEKDRNAAGFEIRGCDVRTSIEVPIPDDAGHHVARDGVGLGVAKCPVAPVHEDANDRPTEDAGEEKIPGSVPVQIGSFDMITRHSGSERVGAAGDRPAAGAEEPGQTDLVDPRQQEVRKPIPVEIRHGNPVGTIAGGMGCRVPEPPGAVTDQHGEGALEQIGHREIQHAVLIQVHRRQPRGPAAARIMSRP